MTRPTVGGQCPHYKSTLAGRDARPTYARTLLGEGRADDFLIVANVDAAVGEGGLGPDYHSVGIGVGRLKQMSAADLLISLRRQVGDDEIA